MTKCFNIVSNVNIWASGKRKKDQNIEQSTWQPWKESRVAWGCGERVGRPQGGEICWRSKVGVGEVGELGPRKEGWRRVGHLTGGGHPLSQSTSVTVPTHTTTTLYHTQCLAEARVEWELVFGAGELVELLAAGRDTHWASKCHQPNTSAPPPPPETTHQLHLPANLGRDLSQRRSPHWPWRVFEKGAPLKKT